MQYQLTHKKLQLFQRQIPWTPKITQKMFNSQYWFLPNSYSYVQHRSTEIYVPQRSTIMMVSLLFIKFSFLCPTQINIIVSFFYQIFLLCPTQININLIVSLPPMFSFLYPTQINRNCVLHYFPNIFYICLTYNIISVDLCWI